MRRKMNEQLTQKNNEFDLGNDINKEDIGKLYDIVKILDYDEETGHFSDFYTLEEKRIIRESLGTLYPEESLESDPILYQIIQDDLVSYLEQDDLERFISNALFIKKTFPEKTPELNINLDNIGLDDEKIYTNMLKLLRNSSYGDDILQTYQIAANMRTLFPENFENLDLLEILRENAWGESIQREIERIISEGGEYQDKLTDFLYNIKIVQFPDIIEPDSKEWSNLKDHIEQLRADKQYTIFAEYIAKLHTISAKDVQIDKEKLNLIF